MDATRLVPGRQKPRKAMKKNASRDDGVHKEETEHEWLR
jgi:hypothetical protein